MRPVIRPVVMIVIPAFALFATLSLIAPVLAYAGKDNVTHFDAETLESDPLEGKAADKGTSWWWYFLGLIVLGAGGAAASGGKGSGGGSSSGSGGSINIGW